MDDVETLKVTHSAKFAHYRPKIQKVIESLTQHPLSISQSKESAKTVACHPTSKNHVHRRQES